MRTRALFFCMACLLLMTACGSGATESSNDTTVHTASEQAKVQELLLEPTPQGQIIVVTEVTDEATQVPAVTKAPTPEPTPDPTPEPTATPVPKLGVLDGKFADKFVTGAPVLTDVSYQSETLAIFLERVEDASKTITNHTFIYYIADVYFQNMEDLKSCAAKSWKQRWDNDWLDNVAKNNGAIFAVSGDFTLTRKQGLVIRNGELLQSEHDASRDVGVIFKDGHMETYLAQNTPAEQLLSDPDVWQILGFGPELLDENGQPKTKFNDPNKVSRANIRNAVGYFEPGHYCFVYVQPYKTRKDDTCLDMESLSKLMYELGCIRAYNLDGGGTAGMYFNGKLVNDKGLGPTRKNHDIYFIPAV